MSLAHLRHEVRQIAESPVWPFFVRRKLRKVLGETL